MTRFRATLVLVTIAAATFLVSGPAAAQDASVSVDPSTDLADGDTVTVTVTGFPASSTEFVSGQCVTPVVDPLAQCDTGNIVPVPLDANGDATFEITVKTGPVGSGNCGFGADDCVILVGSLSQPENGAAPIAFADPAAGDGTPQPTAVNSGDQPSASNNAALLFAAAAGLFFVAVGAFGLRRRAVRS